MVCGRIACSIERTGPTSFPEGLIVPTIAAASNEVLRQLEAVSAFNSRIEGLPRDAKEARGLGEIFPK